jgi:hypothetical protein
MSSAVDPHRLDPAEFEAQTDQCRARKKPCMRRSGEKLVNSDPPRWDIAHGFVLHTKPVQRPLVRATLGAAANAVAIAVFAAG